jgi:hypothetical protein
MKLQATAEGDCLKCTFSHALFTTTSGIAAVNNATTGCICAGARTDAVEPEKQVGYYTTLPGNATLELSKLGVVDRKLCLNCPNGADCEYDGMSLASLPAQTGYWRPTSMSTVFSSCIQAYKGSDSEFIAASRCCPVNATTNASNCKNNTFAHSDEQCLPGYSGVLCAACAKDYVMMNGACEPCTGGASMQAAFEATAITCASVWLIIVILLLCSKAEGAAAKGSAIIGQVKLLLTFVQILGSLPGVYDGVPWPTSFLEMTIPLAAINFDVFALFERPESCQLSVNFLEQFAVHMALPGMLFFAMILAYVFSTIVGSKDKAVRVHRWAMTAKMIIIGTLFMYPGLATRVFTMFRCKSIDGVEGEWLEADFSIQCWKGSHATYINAAYAFLGFYILGVPLFVFIALLTHRKSLHDESHPKHQDTAYELGGLYMSYEPKYWWFELVIILHKMFMTGAMCIIGSGTPAQPLVACLFQLFILLVTLKLAPYDSSEDDWSSFVSGLTLMLIMLLGFGITSDDRNNPTFDINIIATALIVITSATGIFELGMMMWVCYREVSAKRKARKLNVNTVPIKQRDVLKKKTQPQQGEEAPGSSPALEEMKKETDAISMTTVVPISPTSDIVQEWDCTAKDSKIQGNNLFKDQTNIANIVPPERIDDILHTVTPPSSPRDRLPSLSSLSENEGIDDLHVGRKTSFSQKKPLPNIQTNTVMSVSVLCILFLRFTAANPENTKPTKRIFTVRKLVAERNLITRQLLGRKPVTEVVQRRRQLSCKKSDGTCSCGKKTLCSQGQYFTRRTTCRTGQDKCSDCPQGRYLPTSSHDSGLSACVCIMTQQYDLLAISY